MPPFGKGRISASDIEESDGAMFCTPASVNCRR
jgi:hypothetical protein